MGRVSTCQKNCNTIDLRGAQVNNYNDDDNNNNNDKKNNNVREFVLELSRIVWYLKAKYVRGRF